MKTVLSGSFIFLGMVLIFTTYPNKVLGVNQDTLYRSITISLKDYYGKEQLRELKKKLWNAAVNGDVKAYKNDTLKSTYVPEELLRHGSDGDVYTYYDSDSVLIDTVVRDLFTLDDINSYSIGIEPWYHPESNNYELVFTGFALNYDIMFATFIGKQLIYNLPPLYSLPIFYISTEDILKVLGQKDASDLFNNCYKAMLKSIHDDKTEKPDNKTTTYFNIGDYIGTKILNDINTKMYNKVSKGLNGTNKTIPSYKTCHLEKTYTIDELFKRGCTSESIQMADPFDPNYEKLIDTFIENPFRPSGSKLYSVFLKWGYNEEKMYAEAKLTSFGMYVPYSFDDKPEKYYTLFWLDWKDAEAIYTAVEVAILKYAFYKALIDYEDSHIK